MPTGRLRSVLAVDVGGTKTIVALVSAAGKIVYRRYFLTLAEEGAQAVINGLLSAINRSIAQARQNKIEPIGIGIAFAGILDTRRGVVTASPNLPGWRDVPLKDVIASRSGLATYIINDANAAALGEHRCGAGRGFDNMLYLTASTGIGGGIIIDGELYSGADGCAGEFGHMTIKADGPKCHCGNFGCLESLASGWAIAQEAMTRIKHGEKTSIIDLVDGRIDNITAETVATAARQGDRIAYDIVAKAADYLGIGLANLVNIFNPELIVIGGGLSKMGNMMLGPARKIIKERAFRLPAQTVRIVRARLGSNAGIIGAAVYVSEVI
jgi:glucokinase